MAKRAAKPAKTDTESDAKRKFLEHGTDPSIAKKAIEDATTLSRGLWISFLVFGIYLVITFAGVDHRDLLLETPIMLPVLNAPLPLVTFFWVAPILFVIYHLYLLLSLKLLADQVHNYVRRMEELGLDIDEQDKARLQLPNFVVVQVLGGTSSQMNSWAGKLLSITAFLTLVAGPLLLLLFAQLIFLPYHSMWVIFTQRFIVMIDTVLIWYFWRAILKPSTYAFLFRAVAASIAVWVLTAFVFTYPGETLYGLPTKMLFVETGHLQEQVGLNVFFNTLVLPNKRIVDEDHFKRLEQRNKEKGLLASAGERTLEVTSNRDFRNANFESIDLRKANLNNSILDGAILAGASIQGATFHTSSLRRANLNGSSLTGASFNGAELHGAQLIEADLRGASLRFAKLLGAELASASLQSADLTFSQLIGARFDGALLQGSILIGADLRAASLIEASLAGIYLIYPNIPDIVQRRSRNTSWNGATLRSTNVWSTQGVPNLSLSDLTELQVKPRLSKNATTQMVYESVVLNAVEKLAEPDAILVKDRLRRLELNSETDRFWSEAKELQLTVKNAEEKRTLSLIDTACNPENAKFQRPYVAEGIIRNFLLNQVDQLDKHRVPLLDRLIQGCPGTIGIDPSLIQELIDLREMPIADEPAKIPSESITNG